MKEMKKIAAGMIVFGMLFAGVVFAQTEQSAQAQYIQALQRLIVLLKIQLVQLEQQLAARLSAQQLITPNTTYQPPSSYYVGQIPAGYAASQISPFYKKITLGSVSAGYGTNYEQISLSDNSNDAVKINVSGWMIQGIRGSTIIDQGIAVYDPIGLTPPGDIFLGNGDTLNLYLGANYAGPNLRINKCIGYLANAYNFNPPLSQSCPAIDYGEIASFSDGCQNYIQSLGSCELPSAEAQIPVTDFSCRSYLNTVNYKGCFDRHRNDPDFLTNEWRAWGGVKIGLGSSHDQVRLLDRNGLLVDYYNY